MNDQTKEPGKAGVPPVASDEADRKPTKLYGRQKSRPLSKRQKHLMKERFPELRLDLQTPFHEQFKGWTGPIWLEIGFGGGEHLVWQAANNPDILVIGCEPFINGIAKVVTAVEERGLSNIRLYDDDAREVLDWLEPGSIDRAFVLFPDPWPKKRHHKRRFLSVENFNALARVLKNGTELRIATDIDDYARSLLLAYRKSGNFTWTAQGPNDWRNRPADWPETRYEQKAIRDGRKCNYLSFVRR